MRLTFLTDSFFVSLSEMKKEQTGIYRSRRNKVGNMMKSEVKMMHATAWVPNQNKSRRMLRKNRGWDRSLGKRSEEGSRGLCFVFCLLMRCIWNASETMSHPRKGLSPLSGPGRLSVQDYAEARHLTSDFSLSCIFTVLPAYLCWCSAEWFNVKVFFLAHMQEKLAHYQDVD